MTLILLSAACSDRDRDRDLVAETPEDTPDAAPEVDAPPLDVSDTLDPDDTAPDAQGTPEVRVATFNVKLFFDTICDSGDCTGSAFEQRLTQEAFEQRADALADAIRRLDSDVVVLQELESYLNRDALATRLADLYPVVELAETGGAASVDVAVLSRGELLAAYRHRHDAIPLPGGGTTRFARELYEAHIQLDGARLIVFAAHFTSKVSDADGDRRLAEATAARQLILEASAEHPQALVLLAGDLNDTPGSLPINALEDDPLLTRVAAELTDDEDATYVYFGDLQAIDHIFIVNAGGGAYVPGTAEVMWDTLYGYGGSDHAALRAGFTLPE